MDKNTFVSIILLKKKYFILLLEFLPVFCLVVIPRFILCVWCILPFLPSYSPINFFTHELLHPLQPPKSLPSYHFAIISVGVVTPGTFNPLVPRALHPEQQPNSPTEESNQVEKRGSGPRKGGVEEVVRGKKRGRISYRVPPGHKMQ